MASSVAYCKVQKTLIQVFLTRLFLLCASNGGQVSKSTFCAQTQWVTEETIVTSFVLNIY